MNATNKLLTISGIVLLPWVIIRLTNLETKILDFLDKVNISDVGIIAILIVPLLVFWAVKWLFEPIDNAHKSYSGGKDMFIKFRK